ncbi:MAG TPA: SDR family oxidoreductase [Bacteroidota bacterium]|nr:SDR family oxidoreductase [Bacteroidota bacterium]
MKTLKDKVIVVVGGTGDIGRATADLLARLGAIVVIASRTVTETDPRFARVREMSPRSSFFQGDFSVAETWNELLSYLERACGEIDALVMCAGTLNPSSFESLSSKEMEATLRVNCLSVMYGMQAMAPLMRQRHHGVIVTVGSIGGLVPMPFGSVYSASKFAVRGFMLSMQEELKGSGVDACLLTLGSVHSRMLAVESANDDCVISFINKPLDVQSAAGSIADLLLHPRAEVVLPTMTGWLSKLCAVSPPLFSICYNLLRSVGRRRMQSYRRTTSTLHTA